LDNVLKKSYSSIEEHIKAISSYAFNLRDTNPRQSVDIYIRALELAQQDKNDVWVAKVSNWLGTAYRRLSEYDIAIEYLQKAIDIRKQYKLDGDVAASKNNLAYVYRLKGDIDKAIHLARSAFATRQKMNDQQGIAYSLLTIAEIYRDRNDENGAWERFTQARKIFQGLGNELEVANVDIKLANIYRKRHEPILAKEFIDEAIEIFRQLKNVEGLADALNESACEQRKKARELSRTFRKPEEAELAFRTAEKEFQESIDICYKTGNQYRLADNLSDLALLYRYWYEHDIEFGSESNRKFDFIVQAKRASYKAITISRRANLVLPESRALEALGDLYYAHKLYFKAFAQYYLPAGIILAEYYEKGSSRYQILFDRIHRKILNPNIRNTELKLCASYLARRWKEEGKATIAKGFVDLYQGIADEIEDGD
jgi:tetratricopeptide (TPR) repeat protein